MSYLHIGQNAMLPEKRIIGIFDLDITSQSKRTREFLEKAEQGRVGEPGGQRRLILRKPCELQCHSETSPQTGRGNP